MNVLVTEGENRSTLAVTRSLGRRGCKVIVTGKEARNLASSSRFCARGIAVPDPLSAGDDYVRAIGAVAAKSGSDVILPMTEPSIHLLGLHRDRLPENAILACPPTEMMQAVSDKASLCRLAEKLQVPIPQTLYLTSAYDLPAVIETIRRYPVVIKPALSKVREKEKFLSGDIRYAGSQEELEWIYRSSRVLRYPSMIQEKIIGTGTGLFTLYDMNRHLALFSHRRLREKPPSGGVSVVSESVPLDKEMVDAADRLLGAIKWRGVAMVEFKRDQRDGKVKLMEINGRFWGTLQLAIACGVDFPGLYLDYLLGQYPSVPITDYQSGHKLKWFFGTLDHLFIRLKNSEKKLNLPPSAPSRVRSIIDFLTLWEKNASFDVFDRYDPAPFRFEARSYLIRQAGKGYHRDTASN